MPRVCDDIRERNRQAAAVGDEFETLTGLLQTPALQSYLSALPQAEPPNKAVINSWFRVCLHDPAQRLDALPPCDSRVCLSITHSIPKLTRVQETAIEYCVPMVRKILRLQQEVAENKKQEKQKHAEYNQAIIQVSMGAKASEKEIKARTDALINAFLNTYPQSTVIDYEQMAALQESKLFYECFLGTFDPNNSDDRQHMMSLLNAFGGTFQLLIEARTKKRVYEEKESVIDVLKKKMKTRSQTHSLPPPQTPSGRSTGRCVRH